MDKKTAGELSDVPWLLSTRLMLAVLAFMGFVLLYSQRVGMSVAIVCMVNHTYIQSLHQDVFNDNPMTSNISFNTDNEDNKCLLQDNNRTIQDGPFKWEKGKQGHLLGAFFYGYVISQIPAGLLSQKFGAKWVYAGFYLLSSVSTLLTPVAARLHYGFAIAVRVLSGIGTGAAFPTMHSLWGHWSPPFERSKLAGITYAGVAVANVITWPVSGVLCEHGFDGGWASIFYILGGLSLGWLILWAVLVSDTPSGCRCISNKEIIYITENLKEQVSQQKKEFKTPWLSFVTSLPVWAIAVANITSDWGVYTLITGTPTYMNEVLKFDIQMNGLLSALPCLGSWVGIYIFSFLADKLMSTGKISTATTRKIFNTIGMIGPAVFLIGLGFVDCTKSYVAVFLLTLANTCLGAVFSGFIVNHMDIAPQYAGTLIGITNCLAAITGFIAPYLASVLTINQSREEWQVVFFITAALQILGAIFYNLFASGEPQSWALQNELDKTDHIYMDTKARDKCLQEKEKMLI